MSAATVLNQASALQTANNNSGDLSVSQFVELAVDINITGNQGSSPTINYFLDRKGADGIYYPVWQSAQQTGSSAQVSTAVGAGCSIAQGFGSIVRFRWTIGGSSTPGFTFSASIIGK